MEELYLQEGKYFLYHDTVPRKIPASLEYDEVGRTQ